MVACLAWCGVAANPGAFRAAVCGVSASTVCLPVLVASLAAGVDPAQGGAALAALETANTLNRVVVSNGRALGLDIFQ
jgi:hypothetical protein